MTFIWDVEGKQEKDIFRALLYHKPVCGPGLWFIAISHFSTPKEFLCVTLATIFAA